MNYLDCLYCKYIDRHWSDAQFAQGDEELLAEIKATINPNKKRFSNKVKKKLIITLRELYQLRHYLRDLSLLNVFGFNSGRFDLNVLIPFIACWAAKRSVPLRCLKRATSYISLQVGNIVFKDIMNFNSPVTLEKYIR